MTQNSKKDIERKEKTFDEYYNERILATQEPIERVNIVYEKLKRKYEDYDATEAFIEYLCSVEKIFVQAEKEKWSVEKTEDEMIKGEIYIMSQTSEIDEVIFHEIHEEFKKANHDVKKIQDIAGILVEKYSEGKNCQECEDFIMYVRDSLFIFSHTLDGDKDFDELSEAKEQIIQLRMKMMAVDNRPPLDILQKIYDEFVEELRK